MEVVRRLRAATAKQLIVAGGITTSEEVDQLDALEVEAVVGMAIYTQRMKLGGWPPDTTPWAHNGLGLRGCCRFETTG